MSLSGVFPATMFRLGLGWGSGFRLGVWGSGFRVGVQGLVFRVGVSGLGCCGVGWEAVSKGNQTANYHSHPCPGPDDQWHIGAEISITAAALVAAVAHFKSDHVRTPV